MRVFRRRPKAQKPASSAPEDPPDATGNRPAGKHVRTDFDSLEAAAALAASIANRDRVEPVQRPPVVDGAKKPSAGQWMSANNSSNRRFTVDWCRFRRNSHCYFSGIIDEEATVQAGYLVHVPMDRGYCWRSAWEIQQLCGSSQPGPRANSAPRYMDATVPWEALGQREYPTEISKRYAVPLDGGADMIGAGESPAPLSPDDRVVVNLSDGPWPAPPTQTPVLEPAVDRPRALADLVQLRTGGYLSWNEFKHFRARLGGPAGPVPLGASDTKSRMRERVGGLLGLGVINDEEATHLAKRLPRPMD
jgi:hypothetical protein